METNSRQPLVSIITPCFNGERYLDRYFQCVLSQTYPNLELVFINDGSTDKTEEIALGYREKLENRNIRYIYEYQKNQGQAAALNRGLKLFTGEYLTWPDADDEMTANNISEKVKYLLDHPDISMVRSNGIIIDDSGNSHRLADKSACDPEDIFEDILFVKTYGCCGCYMISRELFLKCYPDRNIFESRAGQNWQLLVPAASRTLCGYIDKDLYIVYAHDDSHSRKKKSPKEDWEHWNRFTDVLLNAIQASDCDKEKYAHSIKTVKAEQYFYYAVTTGKKDLLLDSLKQLKQYRKISLKEYLLFVKKYTEFIIQG